jgi:hypothetical protein
MALATFVARVLAAVALSLSVGAGTVTSHARPHTSSPAATVVGFYADPALYSNGGGGWELWSDGEVDTVPDTQCLANCQLVPPCDPTQFPCFYGDLPTIGVHVDDIVSMLANPTGTGYYLLGRDGGVFSFRLHYYGSMPALGESGLPPAIGMSWCGTYSPPTGYAIVVNAPGSGQGAETFNFNCF